MDRPGNVRPGGPVSVRFHALTCTDVECDPGCDIGDPAVIGGKVTVADVGGIFGPDWTAGLDTVEWVRRQRD